MKRVIITANPQVMRAFRPTPSFTHDHIDFEVSEIELSSEVTIPRPWQDIQRRFLNMAEHIDELIEAEHPGLWILAAPLSTMAHVLPALKPGVRKRLGGAKIEDMTALPAAKIARRFAPRQAAAA